MLFDAHVIAKVIYEYLWHTAHSCHSPNSALGWLYYLLIALHFSPQNLSLSKVLRFVFLSAPSSEIQSSPKYNAHKLFHRMQLQLELRSHSQHATVWLSATADLPVRKWQTTHCRLFIYSRRQPSLLMWLGSVFTLNKSPLQNPQH